LYRFKAEVEMRSPSSIVEIDTEDIDGQIHFTRFFCCFKAAIDGFRNGCRPYISIDSTALNGQWNGHMPAAQALDGHNWMFPLAFGFFQSETKPNWVWFMEQLSKAIGHMDNLAGCTDACKDLEAAVAKVWPHAEKRECFRHLMENMKKYYTGEVYGKNMWPAVRHTVHTSSTISLTRLWQLALASLKTIAYCGQGASLVQRANVTTSTTTWQSVGMPRSKR
jgi:hypothetical protein